MEKITSTTHLFRVIQAYFLEHPIMHCFGNLSDLTQYYSTHPTQWDFGVADSFLRSIITQSEWLADTQALLHTLCTSADDGIFEALLREHSTLAISHELGEVQIWDTFSDCLGYIEGYYLTYFTQVPTSWPTPEQLRTWTIGVVAADIGKLLTALHSFIVSIEPYHTAEMMAIVEMKKAS